MTRTIALQKGSILDIGCGGGLIAESLPYYYPNASIYGCDVSRTAISYAKKLGSGNVKYAVIHNGTFPYKSNFFDVCICLDVLEHVPDIGIFLKEVRRVLQKDGKFFLIVPCEGQPFTYTWLFQKIHVGQHLTFRQFGHIHPEFTHASVVKLLELHGFAIKEKAYSEHLFYQLMHLLLFTAPKVMLEIVLGKKSDEYTNSSLIRSPKSKRDILMIVRAVWFKLFHFMMMYPMNWETVLMERVPLGAWKLHVLASARSKFAA